MKTELFILRRHFRSLFWCCLLLSVLSCRKDPDGLPPDNPDPGTGTPFSEIRQVFVTLPNTPLGLMMYDPNVEKDIYYFGDKKPGGQLQNLTYILVTDRETGEWVLYELNEHYLPVHIRLSKGYTLKLSGYDLSRHTVTLTGYETASQTQLGSVANVSFDPNAANWATTARQTFNTDLRNARVAAECNQQKYNQAAAAYFALNAAGCILGISEFSTGVGIPLAILSAYNTYQNCKGALGVLGNIASGRPALDCPTVQDFGNNALSCLEGELNAFSGNPYNFVQSCASGYLANAAAAANCNCDKDDDPPLGRSTGDPHLRTMDHLLYDFMAVGEFVALTSATDNFEIQARQQDVRETGTVSLNTGVAVRSGNDVICVLVNPSRLYVNRNPVDPDFTQMPLSGGNVLTKSGNELKFTNGQGDAVTIRWLGDYYLLDYLVYLNPARAGKVSGLLGNYDGIPRNDLVIRNGQPIDGTFEELYPAFADSWRITQAQSLFVYESGETTETFTDRSLPRSKAEITEDRRQWATQICQQAGITDPEFLQDCIYDVAVTGDERLAESSQWAQQATGIVPALELPAASDLNQFTNVRLEISSSQRDPDQINLLDFDTGKTYAFKDGAANTHLIDAIGYEYCATVLAVPSRIRQCGFSCGSGGVWDVVKDNWTVFKTGSIRYTQTNDPATNIPAEQWNSITSVRTLEILMTRLTLDKDENFPFGATDIENDNGRCTPQYLRNKSLYAFMTQEGKRGVFRITGTGFTPENRRWYTLDIKVQK
jgi:hypothetical protein